jgi:hypothetical protein
VEQGHAPSILLSRALEGLPSGAQCKRMTGTAMSKILLVEDHEMNRDMLLGGSHATALQFP